MNKLESFLIRTRKTVIEGCDAVGIKIENAELNNIEECSSCGVWYSKKALIPDLDGNPICKVCYDYYGP